MFPTIAGYEITDKVYESSRSVVYRGRLANLARTASNPPVILKILQPGHATQENVGRFRLEFDLTRTLTGPGIIRALALVESDNRLAMVLEDFGGQSLAQGLEGKGMDTAVFLPLSLQICDALGSIHQQNLIHKDINPANIVWNRQTNISKMIDFGLATTLPRENPEIRSPNVLEGTLAYISPEQTGRMNRAMDYRSDFYSLGVTFYQLVSGQLPFVSDDALEMIHAHLARQPISPHELNSRIPQPISDIIMRLLAKNAEDRYQSAFGLKADLEKCLRLWEGADLVSSFDLGQHDVGSSFQLPQKLYGRAAETDTLLQAFHQVADVAHGQAALVLVAGQAGVGKSALVQELYKPVTARRGYFIAGKFDQLQNAPYAPLLTAFNSLLNQILTEGEAELAAWRAKLTAALGANGQVMVEVLPVLELIMGPQTAVPDLLPAEAENRFIFTCQNFITVFAQANHPLILFLDDWQWMDGASRQLLQNLLTGGSVRHLLLIGAYRDNEMTPGHPVRLAIDKIAAAGTAVNTITLTPLPQADLNQFVADTLHTTPAATTALAELIQTKTGGNPFFLGEFMKSLYAAEWLTFNFAQGCWQWDLAHIQSQNITDNVVRLMTANIQKLDVKTQMTLTLAACIGSRFDLQTLALVYGHSVPETAVALWPAIVAGLVLPLTDDYKSAEFDASSHVEYKFAHDRIQQAAYALIPETDRQSIHWQIGQFLRLTVMPGGQSGAIFETLNHLNLGRACLSQTANRVELAQLNLQAAQAASEAAAFTATLEYALVGIEQLNQTPAPWQEQYELMLALVTTAVSAATQSANYPQMEKLGQLALENGRSLLDKIPIYRNILRAYAAQNKMAEAVALALPLLRELGINLPEHANQRHLLLAVLQTRLALRGKKPADLLDMPLLTDATQIATIELLTMTGTSAYYIDPQLFALIVLNIIQLYARHGNHPEGPRAFAAYGLMLVGYLNDVDRGIAFGELGMNLVQKLNAREHYPGTAQLYYHYLSHWKEHIRLSLAPLTSGYQIGLETGSLDFASYCSYSHATHAFYSGISLHQLIPIMAQSAAAMQHYKQDKLYYVITMFWQTAVNLHGRSDTPWQITGEHFDEVTAVAQYHAANDRPALCTYLVQKGILLYLFGRYREAQTIFAEVETVLDSVAATYMVSAVAMYDALTQCALIPTVAAAEQTQLLKRVTAQQKKLEQWAQRVPVNFQHKAELVAAEKARVLGQWAVARPLYDQAIQHAHENEFLQEEALAFELAGQFHENRGNTSLAGHYLQHAHQTYTAWGGTAKTSELEMRFPHYFPGDARPSDPNPSLATTATISSTNLSSTAVLDLGSVIKASQALSGEIKLDSLLDRLMELVIENAGAQVGYLLLPAAGEWQVAARGGAVNGETAVAEATAVAGTTAVPPTILNYVTRARENVVLDDAAQEGPFIQDPLISQRQTRSVLCLPLLHHGDLTGILYLENNLAPGAFTPDRLTVLNLLASQAAISLENARLYGQLEGYGRTLEQQVQQRTAALAQANQEAQTARAAAEIANENKSLFLSNMNRELRTPLNSISGFTRLVRQNAGDALPEKQIENLDKVLVSADHLLDLINTVINIAKIESGQMDVHIAEFEPVALIESCITTTQPLLKEGVELHRQFTANLPTIHSDPAKIKQIVINLLSNAAKFTHEGQIVVRMECQDGRLTLAVSDSGIGISATALSRVFEEFQQAESTTRQQYGGTGLGLPISRGLARLLGGDLTAVSEPGIGSTFTLTVPINYEL